jgi:TRAP-type uncharacterized transport system substrate-binding protein
MTLPAIAVGGPEAAAGLIRGDWEFAHTGTVPVAEEVLKGKDVVILATPTSDFPKSFVMTRKEITQLAQLGGKKVGVLTETGQTSVATRITVEQHPTLVGRDHAGHDLDQRRFSGAVLAKNRMDAAGFDHQVGTLQGLHAAKALGNALHDEQAHSGTLNIAPIVSLQA